MRGIYAEMENKMKKIKEGSLGVLIVAVLAAVSKIIAGFIPFGLISAGVFALLIGMIINPYIADKKELNKGINFCSKEILRLAIIFMGVTLNFTQVFQVGKYSLFVMIFTLTTAFGGGLLFGKMFGMNWKLSSLISAGTGICGGSAIAAMSPVIEADDSDIAYAISATFLFDIVMVILFPIAARYIGMSDMGYGLWTGTAVNDTSSVVAAGYAFSDAAGNYSIIVKLTRTLSIVPIVLIYSAVNEASKARAFAGDDNNKKIKINLTKIFPWFILMFLAVVAVNSTGVLPESLRDGISDMSKFFMIMALGAIGLKTNFKQMSKSGFKPMLHGFIISALVVIVSFTVQFCMGKI